MTDRLRQAQELIDHLTSGSDAAPMQLADRTDTANVASAWALVDIAESLRAISVGLSELAARRG